MQQGHDLCPVLELALSGNGSESDTPARRLRRFHQRADRVEDHAELGVILPFKHVQALCEATVRSQCFAHSNKRTDDVNTGFDGPFGIEDRSRHDGTVLREGEREGSRMFQAIEPVAICDQFGFFLSRQPEGEILREPHSITLDLLVEPLRRNAIDFRKVSVQYDAVASNCMNSLGNILRPKGWF